MDGKIQIGIEEDSIANVVTFSEVIGGVFNLRDRNNNKRVVLVHRG